MSRSLEKLQRDMRATEWAHRLWTNEDFQKWRESMEKTVSYLSDVALKRSFTHDKDLMTSLSFMGIDPPKNQEEELRLYIAMKAVLGFWETKLSLLETQSSNHVRDKERINELGTNGDIRIGGSVPVR